MEPIIKCIHDQAFNQVLAEPSLKCMNKLLLNKKKRLEMTLKQTSKHTSLFLKKTKNIECNIPYFSYDRNFIT